MAWSRLKSRLAFPGLRLVRRPAVSGRQPRDPCRQPRLSRFGRSL